MTEETFSRHEGFDLATFDERGWLASELPSFRVLKEETYSTFKSRVAQRFSVREDKIRLWVLVNRANKTVRCRSVEFGTGRQNNGSVVRGMGCTGEAGSR